MTLSRLRRQYMSIRSDLAWTSHCKVTEFDAAVKAKLPENATPEQYVEAAKTVTIKCGRCAGTGQFVTMVENGVPKGPGGICFRCEGKGVQNHADAKRNMYYDEHQTVRM